MPEIEPPYKREPSGYERIYQERHHRPPQPRATYWLLGIMGGVFLLELVVAGASDELFALLFPISYGWWLHPWQLLTSTLSHADLQHLFFNGLSLYFFGPTIENVVGRKRYVTLFFVTGAISGVLQVHLPALLTRFTEYDFGGGGGALGASGALMALFGVSVILIPNSKMIIFPIFIPIPLWVAGIGFVAMDLLGAFNPGDRVGNFAHLSGLAAGLLYGVQVKEELRRRGLRLVRS